jgi:hypothetical protein
LKTITACIVTTITYFITLMLSVFVFRLATNEPFDSTRINSGIFMGTCLVILPYFVNGYFCRKRFSKPFKAALITSTITVVCERVLIYIIGFLLVLQGGDGPMDNRPVMLFIQREAAPYYTLIYIIMGLVSICISVLIASAKKPIFIKKSLKRT